MHHHESDLPADGVRAMVLAGGQSTRFGSDKAVFDVDGIVMAERVYRAICGVIRDVDIGLASSTQRNPIPGARVVVDDPEDVGPLGSLGAGLRGLQPGCEWLLVAACDMPGLEAAHVRLLLQSLDPAVDAVVAVSPDGRDHPLFAVYAARCAAAVDACLKDGKRSMRALLSSIAVRRVELPPAAVHNVNRTTDL